MTSPTGGAWWVQPNTKPAMNSELYLDDSWSHPDRYTIIYHRGRFYRWIGTHWQRMDDDTLESLVYMRFKDAQFIKQGQGNQAGLPADYDINPARTTALVQGIRAHVIVNGDTDHPAWLDQDSTAVPNVDFPAREVIACSNALVNARSKSTRKHTPRFFNTTSVGYEYNPSAPAPVAWLRFLNELWPDDVESREALQEIAGYCLTNRTDLQKMFMLIGPPRCGKGTIVRVLTAMLGGEDNVASISLADLNTRFGLEEIESRQLAVMQDARFRSKDDGVAVERILSITGEDPVSIEKKNKGIYSARLTTRFLLVSNELPKMTDESGALRSRVILLRLFNSVDEARRDPQLADKLLMELPGILNWALDGLDRLTERRMFTQPKTAAEDIDLLQSLSSPKLSFLGDWCSLRPGARVPKAWMWAAWNRWAQKTNTFCGSENVFARDLYAAAPGVRAARISDGGGKRLHVYEGIELNEEAKEALSALGFQWTV